MIYSTNIPEQKEKAIERFQWLISNERRIELKEKKRKRTIRQNAYLHLILGWYAIEYGETLEYVKQEVFKKQVNQSIFLTEYVNQKTGEIRDDWKSTANLDTGELTIAIDRFRDYSSKEAGIYLPEPEDLILLEQIENELSKHTSKQYL